MPKIALLLILTALVPSALPAGRMDISTRTGDRFVLSYPNSFQYEAVSPEGAFPVSFTLRYSEKDAGNQLAFQVMITRVDKEAVWKDQAALDRFLKEAGKDLLKKSIEKEIAPTPYRVSSGFGSYSVFTDPALLDAKNTKPGEYRHVIFGALRKEAYLVFLRGYTNSTKADYFRKANAVLENIEVLSTRVPPASSSEVTAIPIPDQDWQIVIDAPPLLGRQDARKGDNYTFRANSRRLNLSVFVENPVGPGGSKTCFEHYWPLAKRNPLIQTESIKISHTETYSRVEYNVTAPSQTAEIVQKDVNYYLAFNGKWIDVHLSITNPEPEDDQIITNFDRGLRCEKK